MEPFQLALSRVASQEQRSPNDASAVVHTIVDIWTLLSLCDATVVMVGVVFRPVISRGQVFGG
jgi:hypothetical protein